MRNTSVDLLTPRQMARESGWSVKSIRKLLAERRIRHLRRGNRYLIPRSAINEFLDANMVEPELLQDALPTRGPKGSML